MRKLAFVLTVMALCASAQADLLTDGGFDNQMTVRPKSGTDVATLAQNTWLTPSGGGIGNWDNCWVVDESGNYAKRDNNVYPQDFLQIIANPGVGDYTLSFDYRLPAELEWNEGVKVSVMSGGEGGDTIGEDIGNGNVVNDLDSSLPISADWAPYSVEFSLDATQAAEEYLVVAFHGNGSGDFDVDNVSLVPEPATMSLLALGGLVALGKRR